jgi:tetratricopeptide (TPR) repeat protein
MKRMRLLLLIFVSIVILFEACQSVVYADSASGREFFIKGNIDYRQGDYALAIENYKKVLGAGVVSGQVYYNLGNAYFKNNDLGNAMVNYLRARRYMPRDPDLKSNISHARSLIENRITAKKSNPVSGFISGLSSNFTLNEITYMCLFLGFLLAGIIIIIITTQRARVFLNYAAAVTVVLLLLACLMFYAGLKDNVLDKKAVVLQHGLEARFEPFENATVFFVLDAGQEIMPLDTSDGWTRIRRPDGRQGWVKSSGIEPL